VQVAEFESEDPALAGDLRITVRLAETRGGTEVTMIHEGLPPGVRPEDDEEGMTSSLQKLAALLEQSKS
jgi:hypothetical protein